MFAIQVDLVRSLQGLEVVPVHLDLVDADHGSARVLEFGPTVRETLAAFRSGLTPEPSAAEDGQVGTATAARPVVPTPC